MDKKTMVIIGAGAIGAGALILMSQPPTYQPGGFAGGVSKKEGDTIDSVTETTETPALADPIYNIFFPDPSFPTIPQPAITEPWWVTSAEPPAPKKEAAPSVWESVRFTQAATGGQHAPSYIFPSPTQLKEATEKLPPALIPETKKETKTTTKPTLDIAKDILRRLGRG